MGDAPKTGCARCSDPAATSSERRSESYKIAQMVTHRRVYSVFFGSSRTDNWLQRYACFKVSGNIRCTKERKVHQRLKSAQHLLSIRLKCTAFTKKVHKVQKVEKDAKSAHMHFCAFKCNDVFIKKLFVIFCAHCTKCAQSAHSAQLFFLMCSFVHLKCIKFRAWVTDPHASSQDNDQACGDLDATTCLPLQ